MDSVIIPAYNRPEFLYLCLEHICKAKDADKRNYIFCLDYGYDPMIHSVLDAFPLDFGVIQMGVPINRVTKQSANVLNGWIAAATNANDGDTITLIEDDVFISTDFFNFETKCLKQNVWASVGAVNFNDRRALTGELDKYYIHKGTYQSIGVSFKRETILKDIAPHYNKKYLESPGAYLEANFPKSLIGRDFIEQDGLIHRISEAGKCPVAFPMKPRCFHAGLYGKNRGHYPQGKLKDRIEFIRSIVYDENELKKHIQNEYFLYDSKPTELNTNYYGDFSEA